MRWIAHRRNRRSLWLALHSRMRSACNAFSYIGAMKWKTQSTYRAVPFADDAGYDLRSRSYAAGRLVACDAVGHSLAFVAYALARACHAALEAGNASAGPVAAVQAPVTGALTPDAIALAATLVRSPAAPAVESSAVALVAVAFAARLAESTPSDRDYAESGTEPMATGLAVPSWGSSLAVASMYFAVTVMPSQHHYHALRCVDL